MNGCGNLGEGDETTGTWHHGVSGDAFGFWLAVNLLHDPVLAQFFNLPAEPAEHVLANGSVVEIEDIFREEQLCHP